MNQNDQKSRTQSTNPNITRDHRERLTKIDQIVTKIAKPRIVLQKSRWSWKPSSDTNCSDKEHGLACGIKACTIEHGDLGV